MFPVLALQVRKRLFDDNKYKADDSVQIFGQKAGVKDAVDQVFNLIVELSQKQEPIEEGKKKEFGDLDSPLDI